MKEDVLSRFLAQIGANVKAQRNQKKLSLEKLGLEIGLTRMQVNRIENGYNITATTLLKLAIALEVDPKDLVKFDYTSNKEDLEKLVNTNKASKIKTKPNKKIANK